MAVIDKSVFNETIRPDKWAGFRYRIHHRLDTAGVKLDVANDVLIVDGATLHFLRALRVRLSEECHKTGRVRPFRKIISGDSSRDDGLQLADMITGAARQRRHGGREQVLQNLCEQDCGLVGGPSRKAIKHPRLSL